MPDLSRRRLLAGASALGGLTLTGAPSATAASTTTAASTAEPAPPPVRRGDPRYEDFVRRRVNARFDPRPGAFRLAETTAQVEAAVTDAVRAGRRITVRSGGHCQEDFVGAGNDGTVLDLVAMNRVDYDPARRAFLVEPGARLGDVYEKLFYGWGVTIPGGQCGTVGAGGHIQGGGYGPLSRLFGSTVDHLHAVEVVVADRTGRARAVVATSDPADPNHDLWWAHTGGGGGNFGVVTRYWLRSPSATGDDPATLLPRPPARLLSGGCQWSWRATTTAALHRLLRNHGTWHEHNSAPGSPGAVLFSSLLIPHRSAGTFGVTVSVADTGQGARRVLDGYLDALTDGVPGTRSPVAATPWYTATQETVRSQIAAPSRYKQKAAYLRRGYTDAQIAAVTRALTADGNENLVLELLSYGGMVNAVHPAATALPQRDSVLKALYVGAGWTDPRRDRAVLDRLARFYADVYAATGGLPVPGPVDDGCYINYPDVDVLDPRWNPARFPWPALYYQHNYPRLQRVKARWDPHDVFHHALSVALR